MSSKEAQTLAAESGDDAQQSWNTMSMQSGVAGPSGYDAADGAGSDGLVGGRSSKSGYQDDFYSDALDADDEDRTDSYLDTPLTDTRGSRWERTLAANLRFMERIYHSLYGDSLPFSEFVRILTLASTLFFMIGGYWLLRSLKDSVLTALCGVTVIPKAKMLSVFVVLGVVSIYNKMLDSDLPKVSLKIKCGCEW